MRINGISTSYNNIKVRSQNFRGNQEIAPSKKEDVTNPKNNERMFQIAALAGIITLACIFDVVQKKFHDSINPENEIPVLTNDTFEVTKEMEDTYQTVLSNKLKRAERNMSKIDFYRLTESMRKLDKFSKEPANLLP